MHLKWKLVALCAERVFLEDSFYVTEGLLSVIHEDIQ